MTSTTLEVKVNDVVVDALRTELNMVGLTVGHSLATIIVDDYQIRSYGINKAVEVKNNTLLLFKGKLDDADYDESQDEKWDKRPIVRISARDLSVQFSELKLTKIYEGDWKADDLIDDILSSAGSTITFTSSSVAPVVKDFVANDEYLLPLIKRILEQVGWEAYVDTSGALIMFDASNPTDSGITFSDGDIMNFGYNKTGMGIRNSIKIVGAPLSFDPPDKDSYTEGYTDWTLEEGEWIIVFENPPSGVIGDYMVGCRGLANGWTGKLAKFNLPLSFIADFNGERQKLWFLISVNENSDLIGNRIRLQAPDDSNYFYIDLVPEEWTSFTVFDEVLGVSNEYIVGENPSGWKKEGSPSWNKITQILFIFQWDTAANREVYVDGLYLEPIKWKKIVTSAASIALYDKRELTLERPYLLTQAAVDAYADEQLILYKDHIGGWRFVVPATKLISGTWKGLVGSKLMYDLTSTRITGTTIICAPYENLRDGYDFVCRVNLLPLISRHKTWFYDITLNPNHLGITKK